MTESFSLMKQYKPLFFNENFCESAPAAGWEAYRGEFVLKEGEIADALGRRKPPQNVLKQVVLLTNQDKVRLLSGSLDELQEFPMLVEKIGSALDAETLVILFTVNIDDPFVDTVSGAKFVFIPMVQGMVWSELSEMAGLEKGDFKGQGAAEKVVTLLAGLKETAFKYRQASIDSMMGKTNTSKRTNHGAV